jgi:hypothetical protein
MCEIKIIQDGTVGTEEIQGSEHYQKICKVCGKEKDQEDYDDHYIYLPHSSCKPEPSEPSLGPAACAPAQ